MLSWYKYDIIIQTSPTCALWNLTHFSFVKGMRQRETYSQPGLVHRVSYQGNRLWVWVALVSETGLAELSWSRLINLALWNREPRVSLRSGSAYSEFAQSLFSGAGPWSPKAKESQKNKIKTRPKTKTRSEEVNKKHEKRKLWPLTVVTPPKVSDKRSNSC